jgi:metallo-beta-lactamase family protein
VPGVKARLVEAGHILGSAAVVLDLTENGRHVKLWFSGDIGRPGLPLVKDPVMPEPCDYLLMESTYGDKRHEDPQLAYDELREVLDRTFARRGKVIIPAFAVGRTQELVYFLNEMMTHREIPRVPVFVDSPLAVHTTDIFVKHPECFDEETRQFVLDHRHPALDFDQLHYVRSVEESKSLNDRKDPMVIISASGMAETGRILHHLKNNIEEKRNTVLIVSWQAPDTLGRLLAERATRVKIFGEEYQVRAEVATIGGLSAHAGQDLLVKYAGYVKGSAKKIILVHGEPKSSLPLMELFKQNNLPPTEYPEQFGWIDL